MTNEELVRAACHLFSRTATSYPVHSERGRVGAKVEEADSTQGGGLRLRSATLRPNGAGGINVEIRLSFLYARPLDPPEPSLFQPQDVHPIGHLHRQADTPILLVCEHAGNAIPSQLGTLGLSRAELHSHIGWDLGALALARGLANNLPGELIYQKYSRLVVDCNRPLGVPDFIPAVSAGVRVPGNVSLSDAQRAQRIREIWQPFGDSIAQTCDDREQRSVPTVLVCMHSFTPRLNGVGRPWHMGLLFNRDDELATLLAHHLRVEAPDAVIALNEPYVVADDEDHTIPRFGEARGIPHVLIEIRNDLIRTTAGQSGWGQVLARSLRRCLEELRL